MDVLLKELRELELQKELGLLRVRGIFKGSPLRNFVRKKNMLPLILNINKKSNISGPNMSQIHLTFCLYLRFRRRTEIG